MVDGAEQSPGIIRTTGTSKKWGGVHGGEYDQSILDNS